VMSLTSSGSVIEDTIFLENGELLPNLRETASLINNSYVHGLMDGQAMKGGYFEPVIVDLV